VPPAAYPPNAIRGRLIEERPFGPVRRKAGGAREPGSAKLALLLQRARRHSAAIGRWGRTQISGADSVVCAPAHPIKIHHRLVWLAPTWPRRAARPRARQAARRAPLPRESNVNCPLSTGLRSARWRRRQSVSRAGLTLAERAAALSAGLIS